MNQNVIDCVCIVYGITYLLREYCKSSAMMTSNDRTENIVIITGVCNMTGLIVFLTLGFDIARIGILIFAMFVPDMNNICGVIGKMISQTRHMRPG